MHPIMLKIGPVTIYSYGLMVALGFALAAFLIYKRAAIFGFDRDDIMNLVIYMLISGIVGARILFILLNFQYYRYNIFEIPDLTKGGLVWYGGFISALAVLILYIRNKKMSFWAVSDLMVPYLALAQAMGRMGCFLNGCCYGIEVPPDFPTGVMFPNESVMRCPVQLYSSLALVLIFFILRLWQDKKHFLGEVFLGYCILYPLKRFLMEFLRGDNPKAIAGLTVSQCISICIFAIAVAVFLVKAAKWKKSITNSK